MRILKTLGLLGPLLALGGSLAAAPPPAAPAGKIRFVHVWPGWRERSAFLRISEYLGGPENTGGKIILRTHVDARTGVYFLARVRNAGGLLLGAKFLLHVVAPGNPEPRTFSWPVRVPAGESVYDVGLTGGDWPGKSVRPIAWELEILGPDGRVLASAESFLWSKPDRARVP